MFKTPITTILIYVACILGFIAWIVLTGWLIMLAWNFVIPYIFGMAIPLTITLLQATGASLGIHLIYGCFKILG